MAGEDAAEEEFFDFAVMGAGVWAFSLAALAGEREFARDVADIIMERMKHEEL